MIDITKERREYLLNNLLLFMKKEMEKDGIKKDNYWFVKKFAKEVYIMGVSELMPEPASKDTKRFLTICPCEEKELDMKAIENYIFEDGENPLKEKTVKANNTNPKNKNTKLKVKSIVVEDEEGREYIKENGVVTVGKEKFNHVDELEKYKSNELSEYKKEYEEKIAEINKAYEDEKIKFLKKINNIADVFMM